MGNSGSRALRGVDAAVQPKLDSNDNRRGAQSLTSSSLPAGLLSTVTGTEGVAAAAGVLDQPLNHQEVLDTAERVKSQFNGLLRAVIPQMRRGGSGRIARRVALAHA